MVKAGKGSSLKAGKQRKVFIGVVGQLTKCPF